MKTEIKLVEWFDDHWYKVQIDEKEHRYIPSVSTKLGVTAKPFLARWRGDIGNREADIRSAEASDRGSRIHHGWYTLTTGGLVVYNPWRHPIFSSSELEKLSVENAGNLTVMQNQDEHYDLVKLTEWCVRVKPQFIASELTVCDLSNNDAGTTDNVMWIQGGKYEINGSKGLLLPEGLYIVDLKSGKQVDDDAYMQMAAYAKCFQWMRENGWLEHLPELAKQEIVGSLIIHTGSSTRTAIPGLSTIFRSRDEMSDDYSDYRAVSKIWERKNKDAKPKVFEFPSQLKLTPMEAKP